MPSATTNEHRSVTKFKCPHVGCDKVFFNTHDCKVHVGKCSRANLYIVDRILEVRGATGAADRKFLVRWERYSDKTWESHNNLPPSVVNEFLHTNGLYDHGWAGGRCSYCDRPCKSQYVVKIHDRKY